MCVRWEMFLWEVCVFCCINPRSVLLTNRAAKKAFYVQRKQVYVITQRGLLRYTNQTAFSKIGTNTSKERGLLGKRVKEKLGV